MTTTTTCDLCGASITLLIGAKIKHWEWTDPDGNYRCPNQTEPGPFPFEGDNILRHVDVIQAGIKRAKEK